MEKTNAKHFGIVSGYFNPLHEGHLEYLKLAHCQVDYLFVIVNNDLQRELKGSKFFQTQDQRLAIVSALRYTFSAVLSIDTDRTVSRTIEKIVLDIRKKYDDPKFTFFNGGDQTNETIPEIYICGRLGVGLVDGLGQKIQSSSWLLENY